MKHRGAFTLIEVLVATALAMTLVTLVIYMFLGSRKMVDRAQVRLELHQRARTMYDRLQDAATAVQHTSLIAAISRRADSSTPSTLKAMPGEVTLVFMRGMLHDTDWRQSGSVTTYRTNSNDLAWEMWSWDRHSRRLRLATSRTIATFVNDDRSWTAGGLDWTYPEQFGIVAQPRRTIASLVGAPTVADRISRFWTAMDDNAWGTMAASGNVGDGSDLRQRAATMMEGVEDFTIDLVCGDGSGGGGGLGTRLDDSADRCVVHDGLYVDGTASASEVAARPRLIRLRFSLGNKTGTIVQQFSFSIPISPFAPAK